MPKINTDNCIACGMCQELCPIGAIEFKTTHGYARAEINKLVCIDCGSCLEVDCPGEAIEEENND